MVANFQDTSGWGSSYRSQPKIEEISGWLSIKVIKGFNFSKKDNAKVEIGVAHASIYPILQSLSLFQK